MTDYAQAKYNQTFKTRETHFVKNVLPMLYSLLQW